MQKKCVHIITFDIPSPPTYGGVIDVFYRLKALHACGVEIYLHCFLYHRERAVELEAFCKNVFYYKRRSAISSAFGIHPYIVSSRNVKELRQKLSQDDIPILFEALHTCSFLSDPAFVNRKKIVRTANIEHLYYIGIGKDEKNFFKKAYFFMEALRLKRYEKNLLNASAILAISQGDFEYFSKKFPKIHSQWLPSFHPSEKMECKSGKSDYILFHGDLSVSSNQRVAEYILNEIAPFTLYKIILAGRNPSAYLQRKARKFTHVEIAASPSFEQMKSFIENAHIHLLLSFNLSGLKLKLVESVFKGRFIICNPIMIAGSGLESCCHIANKSQEILLLIEELMKKSFSEDEISQRKEFLSDHFSNRKNAEFITSLL